MRFKASIFLLCYLLTALTLNAEISLETVIKQSSVYKESNAYQKIVQSYTASKQAYEQVLRQYNIKHRMNYSYGQSRTMSKAYEASQPNSDFTNVSDQLILSSTKQTLVPLIGGSLALNANLSRVNLTDKLENQSDSVALSFSYNHPLTRKQYLGNTLGLLNSERSFYLAKLNFRDSLGDLLISNIGEYVNYLSALNSYKSTKRSNKNTLEMMEISKYKVEVGKESPLNLMRLELQLIDTIKSMADNEASIKEALNNVNETLGLKEEFQEDLELTMIDTTGFELKPFEFYLDVFKNDSYFISEFVILKQQVEEEYEQSIDQNDLGLIFSGNYFGLQ